MPRFFSVYHIHTHPEFAIRGKLDIWIVWLGQAWSRSKWHI